MTDDGTALPPECDFCGQSLDPDESLSPVYIGEQPAPEPVVLYGTAPEQAGYEGRFLGHSVGELSALFDAFDCERVELDMAPVGSTLPEPIPEGILRVVEASDEELRDIKDHFKTDGGIPVDPSDRCRARVIIEPDPPDPEPDLEVCRHCEENFRDEADGWSPSD
jgi:hypothetical protein